MAVEYAALEVLKNISEIYGESAIIDIQSGLGELSWDKFTKYANDAGYYRIGNNSWGKIPTLKNSSMVGQSKLFNSTGNAAVKTITSSTTELAPVAEKTYSAITVVDDVIIDKATKQVTLKTAGNAIVSNFRSGLIAGLGAMAATVVGGLGAFNAYPKALDWMLNVEDKLGIRKRTEDDPTLEEIESYFKERSFLTVLQDAKTYVAYPALKMLLKSLLGIDVETDEQDEDMNVFAKNSASITDTDLQKEGDKKPEEFEGHAMEGVVHLGPNQWYYPVAGPVFTARTSRDYYGRRYLGVFPDLSSIQNYLSTNVNGFVSYTGKKRAFLVERKSENKIDFYHFYLNEDSNGSPVQVLTEPIAYFRSLNIRPGDTGTTWWTSVSGVTDIEQLNLWGTSTIPVFLSNSTIETPSVRQKVINHLMTGSTEGIVNYTAQEERKSKVPNTLVLNPNVPAFNPPKDGDLDAYIDNYFEKNFPDWINNKIQKVSKLPESVDDTVEYTDFLPLTFPNPYDLPKDFKDYQSGAYPEYNPTPTPQPTPDKVPVINPTIDGTKELYDELSGNPDTEDKPISNPNPTIPGTESIDKGTTPEFIPPISQYGEGMVAIYNPSIEQLKSFSQWLWGSSFDLNSFKKLFQDPMQAIIGLHKVFVTPVRGSDSQIQVGYVSSGVTSRTVANPIQEIDMGYISIPEFMNNATDYSPYTYCRLYLPFVGFVSLSVDEIMDSVIHLTYRINVVDGGCIAIVRVKRGNMNAVLYQFPGNMSVQLPITSGNMTNIIASIAGVVASTAATVVTGGATAPLLAGSAANALGNAKAKTEMLGNISGNVGELAEKQPYLILGRRNPYEASNYSRYYGLPANVSTKLSSCSGFTKAKEVRLSNIPYASEAEKDEIIRILKQGIVI